MGDPLAYPARESTIPRLLRQDDFADQQMRQLVHDQPIEICLAFGQWSDDAASMRALWADGITDRVTDDFLSRQWTACCKENERHLLAEGKRQALPDAIVRALGA